jgi:hypothetical protein
VVAAAFALDVLVAEDFGDRQASARRRGGGSGVAQGARERAREAGGPSAQSRALCDDFRTCT